MVEQRKPTCGIQKLFRIRSTMRIVLAIASSSIALLLLPGGRIAHSMFNVPLNIQERSTCRITKGLNNQD